jgi:SAM-dependent methyltransferase
LLHRLTIPLAVLAPGGGEEFEGNAMFLDWPGEGATVLDIGCGAGDLLVSMQRLGWRVEGLDFDVRAVEAAKARGIPARVGTLEEQIYPDASFDAIYLGHVLEHVYEPVSFLRECRRILKSEGMLIVVTPNTRSWGHRRFGTDWRGLEPPRHLHLFSSTALAETLRKAGFQDVTVRTSARGARLILSMSRITRYSRAMGRAAETFHPLKRKLEGIALQYLERTISSWDGEAGEELIGRARTGVRK